MVCFLVNSFQRNVKMKKYLVGLLFLTCSSLWAQFLKVGQEEYYYAEAGEECVAKLKVQNLTDRDLTVIVIRNAGAVAEKNYMCWKDCHSVMTNMTSPLKIPAYATVDNFSGYIVSMPEESDLTINYCFKDVDNVAHQLCVDVLYSSSSRYLKTEEHFSEDLSVYPNPVSEFLTIDHRGKELSELILYDALGNELQRHKLSPYSKSLVNLSSLNQGIYFYALHSGGKRGKVKKLVVNDSH